MSGVSVAVGVVATDFTFNDTANGAIGWSYNGVQVGLLNAVEFAANGVGVTSTGFIGWSSSVMGAANDLTFFRDAANTLALRNGTNAQIARFYNTYTDGSNYERLKIAWETNILNIITEAAGTGTTRALNFGVAGLVCWGLNTSGNLVPSSSGARDLGTSALFVRSAFINQMVTTLSPIAYSASMTPDARLGNNQTISVTDAVAHTINAPTNPQTGQRLAITIRNTTGGAIGVATWNAVFKMTAWTQPGTATSRTVEFVFNGTNWVEVDRTAADVPN